MLKRNSYVALQTFSHTGILTQPLRLRFLRILVIELSATLSVLLGIQKLLNKIQAESGGHATVPIFGIKMSTLLGLLIDLSRGMK